MNSPCIKNQRKCANFGERCDLCTNMSLFVPDKVFVKTQGLRKSKKSSRMGSRFEEENHELNKIFNAGGASMTPNSGAGAVKGDEEILEYVNVAQELKTAVVERYSRGSLSFTIQKEWLQKLRRESIEAGREFWYLLFKFHESNSDAYAIMEREMITSLIYTIYHDRRKLKINDLEVKIHQDRANMLEAQLLAANKEIELLKTKLELSEQKDIIEKSFNIEDIDQ